MERRKPHEKIGPEPQHQTLQADWTVSVECLLAPDMPVGSNEIDAIIRLLGADADHLLG